MRVGRAPSSAIFSVVAAVCDRRKRLNPERSVLIEPHYSPGRTSEAAVGVPNRCHTLRRSAANLLSGVAVFWLATVCASAADDAPAWPEVTTQARPHAYWWWMGSALDTNNLARELKRYHEAGLGGVHIIPIYGAKGWESNYIRYLSPPWMEMLDFTVREAERLSMEVDMTAGTGWCFGGPQVTEDEANAVMVSRQWSVASDQRLPDKVHRETTQALMAFGPEGRRLDLLDRISADGSVDWVAPDGDWTVYAISQKPSRRKVKRAAPGGEGWMLNLAYPQAMTHYLQWFEDAFASYHGAKPRAQYHDSYEYDMDWSPVLFAEFEQRRGYRLQDELDVFLTGKPADRAARVKCDYRETISDIMAKETIPQWVNWSHTNGFLTRNEAHGSPGNWLDLYAAADIPETEMFYKDRNKLVSRFASSAAHVTGKPLVSAETGTWLAEHFTETLADMKYLLDDLFLSGVNHVFYHGTCYSPDEVPWPGWVFYASYEMNPRNSVWHDVPALNAYATRCQSVLQAGQVDSDLLLYWPIHDLWSDPEGMTRNLTVHARGWFEDQPIGKTAEVLWKRGYQFDYVSDAQLASATTRGNRISLRTIGGGSYRAIVVPKCRFISLDTMSRLLDLARGGATVLFAEELPGDVAGLGDLESRQRAFRAMKASALALAQEGSGSHGNILIGPIGSMLAVVDVSRETLFDTAGLMCVRRRLPDGRYYFIANRGDQPVEGWVAVAARARSVSLLDPLTGEVQVAATRSTNTNATEVHLELPAGSSMIVRTFDSLELEGAPPPLLRPVGEPAALKGRWTVRFISGGPELPESLETDHLTSWTQLGDSNAVRFAGTAVYSVKFDAPHGSQPTESGVFELDLGRVCESARVRLNGRGYGTLFTPPFRVRVDHLKPSDNELEVEVTNTSANRIRDLDRRGVPWQNFHNINFVNLNYQKFDASDWPVADSGLLGPVTLTALRVEAPALSK